MKAFNSNTRKLNRVVPKTDINNIVGASLIEKLVNDFKNQLFKLCSKKYLLQM